MFCEHDTTIETASSKERKGNTNLLWTIKVAGAGGKLTCRNCFSVNFALYSLSNGIAVGGSGLRGDDGRAFDGAWGISVRWKVWDG